MSCIPSLNTSLIVLITYGMDIRSSNDPYVTLADDALDKFSQGGLPDNYWVVSDLILCGRGKDTELLLEPVPCVGTPPKLVPGRRIQTSSQRLEEFDDGNGRQTICGGQEASGMNPLSDDLRIYHLTFCSLMALPCPPWFQDASVTFSLEKMFWKKRGLYVMSRSRHMQVSRLSSQLRLSQLCIIIAGADTV